MVMLLPLPTRVLPTFPLSEKVRKAGFLILLDISTMGKHLKIQIPGFPGGAAVENLPANAGDTGSSPGLGRSHMPRSN